MSNFLLYLQLPISLHSHVSSIPLFNGLNFTDWCEQVQFHLAALVFDFALQVKINVAITSGSIIGEMAFHEAWEGSNRLSLMFMRIAVANNLKTALPETDSC